METVKVDSAKRVRLPDAKPGQVLAYEVSGGTFTLTVVKPVKRKEPFPPGSLLKHVEEMNREWADVKPVVPEPEGLD